MSRDRAAYQAAWFQANKDTIRERVQARHRQRKATEPQYREASLSYARDYYAKHRERMAADPIYREECLAKARANEKARRARKAASQ